jgi:hypothetical protein
VSVTAIFTAIRCFLRQALLAHTRCPVCIVGITRLMPGVHQPDPPGLIHDDLRLLPPWRGSSFFWRLLALRTGQRGVGSCGTWFSLDGISFLCPQLRIHPQTLSSRWCSVIAGQRGGGVTARKGVLAPAGDPVLRDDIDRGGGPSLRRPCTAAARSRGLGRPVRARTRRPAGRHRRRRPQCHHAARPGRAS